MRRAILVCLVTTVALFLKCSASRLHDSYKNPKISVKTSQKTKFDSQGKIYNVHVHDKRQAFDDNYEEIVGEEIDIDVIDNEKSDSANVKDDKKIDERNDDILNEKNGNIDTVKRKGTDKKNQDFVINDDDIDNKETDTNKEEKHLGTNNSDDDSLEFSDIQDILWGHTFDNVTKDDTAPLVNTAEGAVRGQRLEYNGVLFDSFLGIPYVAKPVRFQAAKPHPGWTGTLNAVTQPNVCTQRMPIVNIMTGSEDCLYLNVATPSINATALPVLFVVHGGAFKFLSGNTYTYDPRMIMVNCNIIVVSFNYRLGALGFISTRTADAPGNAGMKDIVEALRWVQRNIHNFGGDRLKVTLYGVSSGAAAIEFLLLSKMAKGLFCRIIIQSGSALNYINYQRDPLKNAFQLGKELGEKTTNVNKLMERLRNAEADDIMEAADEMDLNDYTVPGPLTYVPSAEELLPGEEIFLDEHPYAIMHSGDFIKLPSMIGFNDLEGAEFTRRMYKDSEYLNTIEPAFEYLIPSDLMESITTHREKQEIIKYVRDVYFQGERISNETIVSFVRLMGDQIYLNGLFRSVDIQLQYSDAPIYFWQFAYRGGPNNYKDLGLEGAGHAEDVQYLFGIPTIQNNQLDKASAETSKKIIAMVSNFVIYGNPTPYITSLLPVTWYPIQSKESLDYLEFSDQMEMKQDPYRDRRLLWECIYSRRYGLI